MLPVQYSAGNACNDACGWLSLTSRVDMTAWINILSQLVVDKSYLIWWYDITCVVSLSVFLFFICSSCDNCFSLHPWFLSHALCVNPSHPFLPSPIWLPSLPHLTLLSTSFNVFQRACLLDLLYILMVNFPLDHVFVLLLPCTSYPGVEHRFCLQILSEWIDMWQHW